ncbi:MAG TPA: ABC transporter substrate-binding protein [Ottowia sp.]|uniref:ABC transporter substrate-binding protein n=1 Tax=Ottowia sp. TaxID=1898956 RepID=UPI002CA97950|nr:ABC transporter substrate-binding protein [Ottowia sp.]HMN22512.1 ABC transporter substrate-binding protein [Ottowia sp.]
MRLRTKLLTLASALALTVGTPALAQSQGVAKDTLTIGTIQDLSGPAVGLSKPALEGMQLRVDEINEQGGINGRKLVLKVEDSGYDPKRAVLAAQKLVDQDKIFAMVGHLGTPQNIATFPVLFRKNVISFMPLSAGRQMYEPLNRLTYSFIAPYYDQMRIAAPRLAREKGASKPCVIYQDDDFGQEVLKGAEDGLKAAGMDLVEKTSYKRGATDFSSQVAKMKSAGCDFVVLGTIIRETVGTVATARKSGFNPTFLASAAAYINAVPKLGGAAMEGIYIAMTAQAPYTDSSEQPIRFWANKYKTRYDKDPDTFSVVGYTVMDAFIRVAQKAGGNLTTDSFIRAMEGMTFPTDIFGNPEMSFSATKHLGSDAARLSQVQNGKWVVVSEYFH